jgi:hypothetical protein
MPSGRRKPMVERDPWAVDFAQAIHEWLEENEMSGMELAVRLDIPVHTWSHAAVANTITQAEYYARIYCFTGCPEADPRTLPPRKLRAGSLPRAMSETDWQEWAKKHKHQFCSEEDAVEMAEDYEPVIGQADDLGSQIEALTQALQDIVDGGEKEILNFLNLHGRKLGKLYQVVNVFRMEDPKDRAAALAALRRYVTK